jgi:hypothetical protein
MLAVSIIRVIIFMIETASTSESSVNFHQATQRYNPLDALIVCDNPYSSPCVGRDSIQGLPEYEAGVLTTVLGVRWNERTDGWMDE